MRQIVAIIYSIMHFLYLLVVFNYSHSHSQMKITVLMMKTTEHLLATENQMKGSVIDPILSEVPGYWSAVSLNNKSF